MIDLLILMHECVIIRMEIILILIITEKDKSLCHFSIQLLTEIRSMARKVAYL